LGQDAPAGKPDPAPYRIALEQLGVRPDLGMAFEDSASGVRSAHRAGLEVVGMTTTHSATQLREAGADLSVPDFRDARLWRRLRERAGDEE
jgi:beta-phosphoglucomutase